MKRVFVLVQVLIFMLSLAACGNNDNMSSNSSSVTSNEAISSDESSVPSSSSISSPTSASITTNIPGKAQDDQGTEMNFTQIQDGDYSSLLGTWTGVANAGNHDGTGLRWEAGSLYSFSVSSDKIVYIDGNVIIQGDTLKDSAGSHPLTFENDGDSLEASLTDQDVAINWSVTFYKKGASIDLELNNGVKVDNTKNLIVIWTSNNGFTEVFAQTDTGDSATSPSN